MSDDSPNTTHAPLTDLPRRRDTHGTDEHGRHQVNAHGDVDVTRTPKTGYPVQLPLEPGDTLDIDGEELEFLGYKGDALRFRDPSDPTEDPVSGSEKTWSVHAFNTAARNAEHIAITGSRDTPPKNQSQAPTTRYDDIEHE